ncbi:Holliday junction resolvase RuvX [Haloglycomyces albus]|uniref:Holliday junction resolvase RuvX n=1 Tax=Haloglycomyces albus TaxID=526067 RepID=UPI00046CCDAC|nr:Holliday junction resolvase RuvX [Haloglycomyces albus]
MSDECDTGPAAPSSEGFRRGRRLGIDLGKVRIGVALCDPDGILATPLTTIRRDRKADRKPGVTVYGQDIAEIGRLIVEHDVVEIILGRPVTLSGEDGLAVKHTRRWAEKLTNHVHPTPVVMTDERLTTALASRSLHAAGMDSRKQRSVIDQVAAVEILQSWLDRQRKA